MAIAGIGVTHDLVYRKYQCTTQGLWTLLCFPGVGCNQTEVQEPISEEIFAVLQEDED